MDTIKSMDELHNFFNAIKKEIKFFDRQLKNLIEKIERVSLENDTLENDTLENDTLENDTLEVNNLAVNK